MLRLALFLTPLRFSIREGGGYWELAVATPITRREFLTGGIAAGVGLGAALRPLSDPPAPPNLVFVFPDQLRAQALGFMGEEPVLTPVLDRFARQGVVFTQAVSNYPICSPYRAMLWSGRYPLANGVTENLTSRAGEAGMDFRPGQACFSDVLKKRGYSLGYIGKWHLDAPRKPYVDCLNNKTEPAWNEWTPPDRRHGFDFWHAYGTYDQHMRPMYWPTGATRDGFLFADRWGPEYEADMAGRYIRNEGGRYRDPGKPFALVVSMNPPHMPYDQVPGRYLDLYRDAAMETLCRRLNIPPAGSRWGDYYRRSIRGYYAMTSGVDEQFGRILAVLEDAGLAANTIVVFTSDHGNCLGIHDEISKNNAFEESVRIPLLIRWPGRIRPRRDDALVSVPDMMPSLLGLMGLAADLPPGTQGTNLDRLIRTGRGTRPASQLYVRMPLAADAIPARGVRTERHTLVLELGGEGRMQTTLYDRSEDPFQMRDISSERPALVRRLVDDALRPWLERTVDPFLSRLG